MRATARRSGVLVASLLVTATAVVLAVSGCTVSGESTADNDLSSLSVSADDFPVSGATRVPTTAVPFALDGLSGADPATTSPPDCTPARLERAGATVWQVIVGGGATSYSSAVVHSGTELSAVVDQARRCPETRTGTEGAAGTTVTTRVDPAPPGPAGVDTAAVRRTSVTGDEDHRVTTSSLTLIGQCDDVAVYVQYRWPGSEEIDPSAATGLDSLFTKAIDAAFG